MRFFNILRTSALAALFLLMAATLCLLRPGVTYAEVSFEKGHVEIELASGKAVAFDVEWALTAEQRARGLMERKQLADNAGMLFDFGVTRMVTMWMANTLLSLDMVFIGEDGTVVRVAERTTPLSREIVGSGVPVRYVLEIRGGRAAETGLTAGARLKLPLAYAVPAKP